MSRWSRWSPAAPGRPAATGWNSRFRPCPARRSPRSGTIASGGELARFALALKASLASRDTGPQPLMIFDEIDQGVGGAVADAIGVRLKRLAAKAQVLAVTHSPQIAARADQHWRVRKADGVRAEVDVLEPARP